MKTRENTGKTVMSFTQIRRGEVVATLRTMHRGVVT